jgi:hypothetical protein
MYVKFAHARGLFAALEDLFNSKIFEDICIKGTMINT